MRFGELEWLFEKRYSISINADHAAGLRPGSRIELNGVRIGVVDKVSILAEPQDPAYPIHLTVLIDEAARIPANVVLRSSEPLLGGGATLLLARPEPATDEGNLPTDGTATLTGHIRTPLEMITAALDTRMNPLLTALEKFDELSETYLTLGKNLNDLVRPQTSGDFAAGREPNIRTAVTEFNRVMDQVQDALALAQEWLGDEQLRANATAAVEKATALIDKATSTIDRYALLADELAADADNMTLQMRPVLEQVTTTLEQVHRLTRLAMEGQGTVAQLLNNPDLYNSLTDAAERLEQALDEAQLLMQKFKAEGIPFHF